MRKLLFEEWHIRAVISLVVCALVWTFLELLRSVDIVLPAGDVPVFLVFCFAMLYFSMYIAVRLAEPDWGEE